jgi:hypothetical protein
MCVADFPVAVPPLWHVEQGAVIPLWSNRTEDQTVVT